MNNTLLSGKISRLTGAMDDSGPACTFRLGNVPCRARGALAEQIVGRQGWPGHEVMVSGELISEGKKKILAVDILSLVD